MFIHTLGFLGRAAIAAVGATVALAGCSVFVPVGSARTAADFATIKPGMTRDEVLSRFGRPTWTFGVRQENLTILNYRLNYGDCTIYQISVRPDGIVRDAAPAWDPGCDPPSS